MLCLGSIIIFIICIINFIIIIEIFLQVSSLTLKSLEGATSADLAEIEQIVKERMVRGFITNTSVYEFFSMFEFLHCSD